MTTMPLPFLFHQLLPLLSLLIFSSFVHRVFFLLVSPILHTKSFPFCFPQVYLLPQRNWLANYYATKVNYVGTIVMPCTIIFSSNPLVLYVFFLFMLIMKFILTDQYWTFFSITHVHYVLVYYGVTWCQNKYILIINWYY